MAASQKTEVVVGEFVYERDTKNFKVFSNEDGGRKNTEYVRPDDWKALGEPDTVRKVLQAV